MRFSYFSATGGYFFREKKFFCSVNKYYDKVIIGKKRRSSRGIRWWTITRNVWFKFWKLYRVEMANRLDAPVQNFSTDYRAYDTFASRVFETTNVQTEFRETARASLRDTNDILRGLARAPRNINRRAGRIMDYSIMRGENRCGRRIASFRYIFII